jgi:oligopeptide/dipeptide ABC transporter ATP-binding protein
MGTLLSVLELTKVFEVRRTVFSVKRDLIRAVDHVSFDLEAGRTLGVVGESGSGKSTLARCVTLLEKADGGSVFFLGHDWISREERTRKPLRKDMQIIFQDPYSSLNPRRRIADIICEPLLAHDLIRKGEIREKAIELLKNVGLDEDFLQKYPHEMSGGQRQRVAVGRALSTMPKCIIADEPVSSLDVSVQAQIINLFLDIKERLAISFLFISHDLSIVRFLSDDIIVMYRGKVMEKAPKEELFGNPLHPYTRLLINSGNGTPDRQEDEMGGEGGCPFYGRCDERISECRDGAPHTVTSGEHFVACFQR